MEDDFATIEHSWSVGVARQSGQYIYIVRAQLSAHTYTDQLLSIGADPPLPLSHSTLLYGIFLHS